MKSYRKNYQNTNNQMTEYNIGFGFYFGVSNLLICILFYFFGGGFYLTESIFNYLFILWKTIQTEKCFHTYAYKQFPHVN